MSTSHIIWPSSESILDVVTRWPPESKKPEPEDRKEEDIKKFIGLCKSMMKITFDQGMIECAIRLGKTTDNKKQTLLISLKDESMK